MVEQATIPITALELLEFDKIVNREITFIKFILYGMYKAEEKLVRGKLEAERLRPYLEIYLGMLDRAKRSSDEELARQLIIRINRLKIFMLLCVAK